MRSGPREPKRAARREPELASPTALPVMQNPWVPCCGPAEPRVPFPGGELGTARLPPVGVAAAGALGLCGALRPGAERCMAVKGLWSPPASAANCPRQLPFSSSPAWPPGDPETRSDKLHFEFSLSADGLLRLSLDGCGKVGDLDCPISLVWQIPPFSPLPWLPVPKE